MFSMLAFRLSLDDMIGFFESCASSTAYTASSMTCGIEVLFEKLCGTVEIDINHLIEVLNIGRNIAF
jgi:hypothetical protein